MVELPPITRRHALFLDFDGTLAPIVARPELARMSDTAMSALKLLLEGLEGAVAIVSGRALHDLRQRIAPLTIPLAAGHGAEIDGGHGPISNLEADIVERIAARLNPLVVDHPELLLERKAHGAALHYRARPELQTVCAEAVAAAVDGDSRWRVIAGKMVYEIAPASANKGRAILKLLETPPFAGRTPLAVGDDVTDEDMFSVVNARGGLSIKVGAGVTSARHRVESVESFVFWLSNEALRMSKEAEQ